MPPTEHNQTSNRVGAGLSAGGASLESVIDAFHQARAEIAGLFALIGVDPTKTRESSRELGLNRGLTWRLTRMVRGADGALAVADVPATPSMAKFFDACRGRGVPESAIGSAVAALDRFEAAVSACSGDRKTLSMLVANRQGRADPVEQERARRKLFEGGGAVWGVQAQARFVSVFLFPAKDDPSQIDVGHVTGYVGFRRLRAIPWPMSYEAVRSREGRAVAFQKQPLFPVDGPEGSAQLIRDFCDPHDPDIRVSTLGDLKRFELAAGPVGNAGVATCVFGSYLRHLYPRVESDEHAYASFTVLLETPVERVMFDMFVHRDIELPATPTAHLCERLTHPSPPSDDEIERLSIAVPDPPYALGRGASGALTAHISWYSSLVSRVCERLGHSPDSFAGSRFEMAYPPIPTALLRRFPLLPR